MVGSIFNSSLLNIASDFISVKMKENTGLIAVIAAGKFARPSEIFNIIVISHRWFDSLIINCALTSPLSTSSDILLVIHVASSICNNT